MVSEYLKNIQTFISTTVLNMEVLLTLTDVGWSQGEISLQ